MQGSKVLLTRMPAEGLAGTQTDVLHQTSRSQAQASARHTQ